MTTKSISNIRLKGLLNPYLITPLILLSLIIAYLVAIQGLIAAVIFISLCIGLGLFIGSVINVQFGIYTILITAFFIMSIFKVYDFGDTPIALVVEFLIFSVFLGMLFRLQRKKDFRINSHIVNILILIWIAYHFIQVINPNAASRIAWFYAVRNMVMIVLVYFIVCFGTKTSKFVSNIIKLWIALVLLAALYCLKQQYLGFFQFETDWIYSDKQRFGLLYTWGRIRKFSFLEGPMILGIILAYTSVLCFVLVGGPFSNIKKVLLVLAGVIMIWAMIFTGTRTATVLLPIGLLFYAILTFRKEVLMGVGFLLVLGTIVVLIPSSNPNLFIMKTAFRGGEDPSMNVRIINQERIQPYIQSQPLGWGVGSTGGWGAKFSPNTFVGSFPPDSEYVRIAIELGWFGLLFFCTLLFFILKTGIDNYFKTKDLKIKTYYAGILTVTFMTVVAMYPQEAIRVHPTGTFFAICVALLVKMVDVQSIPEKSNTSK